MAINFPSSPTNGQTYLGYYWDATKGAWRSQQTNSSSVITSPTTPTGATAGDLWFNNNDGTLYVYYNDGISTYWTEIKANSALGTTLDDRLTVAESKITTIQSGISVVLFSNPVVSEFSFTGVVNTSRTLNSSVPTNARYIFANVFITASSSDHQNFNLSATQWSDAKNWVNNKGEQPSAQFGNLTQKDHVSLTYFGETDGFTSNFGIWYNNLHIPVSGRTIWINNYGNSGSNSWMYFVIRGYAL